MNSASRALWLATQTSAQSLAIHFWVKQNGFALCLARRFFFFFLSLKTEELLFCSWLLTRVTFSKTVIPLSVGRKWWTFTESRWMTVTWRLIELIVDPGGGGGGGYSTKFCTGRLRTEFQTLTLLYTIFDRKGTPFVYLPSKIVPLSYTYGANFSKLFT